MKYLSNEILNKYIDNELSDKESESVAKILKESAIDMAKYNKLKKIDEGLKRMAIVKISQNFTSDFMEKLHLRTIRNKKQKRFIIYIFSFLVTTIIAFSGTAIYEIIQKYLENTNDSSLLNNISVNISFFTNRIENAFALDKFSHLWIGSSFVLFIILFFLIDEIKKSMHRLSNIR